MKLSKLIKTGKTIFKSKEIGEILGVENKNYLKVITKRARDKGDLILIKKGFYSLRSDYNTNELASKLRNPSYISLETVLQREGLIFQDYSNSVFSVSNNTEEKQLENISFKYFKIKDEVLSNRKGLIKKNGFWTASRERALCDKLYLSPGFYFDNLQRIDWDKAVQIADIYDNKRLKKEILQLKKQNV